MVTGIVIDPRFRDHDTGAGHPERPERIEVLLSLLEERAADFVLMPAREANPDEIAMVHDGAYVEEVAATAHRGWYAFDPDTPTCPRSYDTARLAAGALLSLLDAMIAGTVDNGFAMVRPPGHHAERRKAMGFCLFNNVAVGAEYLRRRYGIERVLVMDWDLHHGNGTQHMFERDPGVMYVSTHQYPFYPGTGALDESGLSDGKGFTVNLPFPAGCGDAEYLEAFRRVVEPIARQYQPQFVLISAGFDAHVRDPLGGMRLDTSAYRAMTRALLGIARDSAGGRCAAVLEGGYDLQAMYTSTEAVLDELRGSSVPLAEPGESSRAAALIESFKAQHGRYWKL